MGAEDFAYFLEKVPGAFIWLGVGEDVSGLHTPTFAFDEEILPRGALRCLHRARARSQLS